MQSGLFSVEAWLYRARVLLRGKNPLSSGEHPDMNIGEDHLGGYIRGRQSSVPTVFDLEHGDPLTWTPDLWRWAYEKLEVRSVLDVGCGEGHSTKFFHDLGCRVLGVDGSAQAQRDSVIPESHVRHDFTLGAYPPDQTFDLVWCCEFVEHVEAQFVSHILRTFACCSGYLMMTYAGPGQPGYHHVNCRPSRYWIRKVEAIGFRFDRSLTKESRAVSPPSHYRAKGLVFVREGES
jgi:SAM-dependent methyltransferase